MAIVAVGALRSPATYPSGGSYGEAVGRVEDALQFLPSRIATGLIVLASVFVPSARPWHAMRTIARDARRHRSMIAGWPVAALAGALELALGGPSPEGRANGWVGRGRAKATPIDIRRAVFVLAVAFMLLSALVAAFALVRRAVS